jgi:hypothetical protein
MTHRDEDIAYTRCSCGRRMLPGTYICIYCLRAGGGRMRIVAKARFKPDRNMVGKDRAGHELCSNCPKLAECRDCARDGRLLACEAADTRDAMGLRLVRA